MALDSFSISLLSVIKRIRLLSLHGDLWELTECDYKHPGLNSFTTSSHKVYNGQLMVIKLKRLLQLNEVYYQVTRASLALYL